MKYFIIGNPDHSQHRCDRVRRVNLITTSKRQALHTFALYQIGGDTHKLCTSEDAIVDELRLDDLVSSIGFEYMVPVKSVRYARLYKERHSWRMYEGPYDTLLEALKARLGALRYNTSREYIYIDADGVFDNYDTCDAISDKDFAKLIRWTEVPK